MSSPPPISTSRWIPLFLNALILPGLGQMQLGQKKKGWFFAGAVLSLTIVMIGKFMVAVFRVMELHRYPRPPTLDIGKTLLEAFQLEKAWILTALLLLALFWLVSILDLVLRPKN
jgi:Na+/melibiose symporter-like transporter